MNFLLIFIICFWYFGRIINMIIKNIDNDKLDGKSKSMCTVTTVSRWNLINSWRMKSLHEVIASVPLPTPDWRFSGPYKYNLSHGSISRGQEYAKTFAEKPRLYPTVKTPFKSIQWFWRKRVYRLEKLLSFTAVDKGIILLGTIKFYERDAMFWVLSKHEGRVSIRLLTINILTSAQRENTLFRYILKRHPAAIVEPIQ